MHNHLGDKLKPCVLCAKLADHHPPDWLYDYSQGKLTPEVAEGLRKARNA